jgi:hypothetical protein
LLVGVITLYLMKRMRTRVPVVLLMVLPLAYMYARATQLWSARDLVRLTARCVNQERADSLQDRLHEEDLISARAMERPAFGWGGYNRMQPTDATTGQQILRGVDGLWIILLGSTGLVGLTSWAASMILPHARLLWNDGAPGWTRPEAAALVTLAAILILHVIDCLFNGLLNPVFVMAAGGLGAFKFGQRSAHGTRMPAAGVNTAGRPHGSFPRRGQVHEGVLRRAQVKG